MTSSKIIGGSLIVIGVICVVLAILIKLKVFEGFSNNSVWKQIGFTSWVPFKGNVYLFNNKLYARKEYDYDRYRVVTPQGAVYDIVQTNKLHSGSIVQIAQPTNPMSVEMVVQLI